MSEIEKRGLGGLRVTALGFGCMSFAGVYGASDDKQAENLIGHVIDQGIDFFDSSDMYGWGSNEQILGRAIKGKRNQLKIATKFGWVQKDGGMAVSGKPDYVAQACEASLKRLGIETIDLYYQHRVDPTVPIEETVGAMKKLVEQGKVRHLGLSEAHPNTIRRAHKTHPIAAVQTEFSLLYREEAEETLKTTRELGIGFVAYAPIGRGFLAGKVNVPADVAQDMRGKMPRYSGDNFTRNRGLVAVVEKMAAQKGCTPAQLAIAWLLARGPDIVPIPGTKQAARADENFGALKVKLSQAEIDTLSQALPVGAAAGPRYPEPVMKGVFI